MNKTRKQLSRTLKALPAEAIVEKNVLLLWRVTNFHCGNIRTLLARYYSQYGLIV